MTKREFDEMFKMEVLPLIAEKYESDGIPDRPARREEYNNLVDSYCKDKLITDNQADKWCITDSLETTEYWL